MKKLLLILLSAAAGAALLWIFLPERSSRLLPGTGGAGRAAAVAPREHPAAPAPVPGKAEGPGAADRAVAELQGQVVVAHGRVSDVGREAGVMLQSKMELRALRGQDPATLTPDQRRRLVELERQRAGVLGILPEVAGFQDNPGEYGSFFGSLLQQAAGLDDAQTKAVTAYMQQRSEAMIAAGLSKSNQPGEVAAQETWEEKRDAFNEESVAGVAKILPPGEAERIGFTDSFMELLEQDFDKAGE